MVKQSLPVKPPTNNNIIPLSVDIEAIGLKPHGGTIWMISVKEGKKTELFESCWGIKELPQKLKKKFADPNYLKIIHNGFGYDIPYLELVLGCKINNATDTFLREVIIHGQQMPRGTRNEDLKQLFSASLEYTMPRYGYKKPDKETRGEFIGRELGIPFSTKAKNYAKADTANLIAIHTKQTKLLKAIEQTQIAILEDAVGAKLAGIKVRGIGFDSEVWKKIALDNAKEFQRRMNKLPKEVENWNSEKQVKKFFAGRGIVIESYNDLDKIAAENPKEKILRDFIEARSLHKAVTSYGLNWFEDGLIDADGRIRCDIQQIINTGRMSMANPNLQQLPAKGLHRAAFVPRKGHVFVIGDFSGQEIGIMAAASNERAWIDALLRGEDVHSLTASQVFANEWNRGTEKGCTFPSKCECTVHNELRGYAKINNFMLAYGGGPQKFAEATGKSMFEAKVIVGKHKRAIPQLTAWLEKSGREALATGISYSADPLRRRRVLTGQEDWQIINQGKNNPIQAAGANMLKVAIRDMPEDCPIVLLIHDEIVLEVKIPDAKKAMKKLKLTMENAADYITGIPGLVKVTPVVQENLLKDKQYKLWKEGKIKI